MKTKIMFNQDTKDYGNRYRNPVFIGQGAFSKVYRVWDTVNACYVVRKEIENQTLARREMQMLKRARHPLFPRYLDYWETGGKGILLMEYVAGERVSDLLVRRNALPVRTCIAIGLEVASGLLYLHEQEKPVIFRDLKPANLMIRQDGRVKLLDMGCACTVEEGVYTCAGTLEFGAPEQFKAGEPIGAYSDVYALGKLLEAMMGEHRNGQRTLAARRLRQVVLRCTCEKPVERLPDMRKVMQMLADVCRGGRRRKRHFDTVIYQKNVWKKIQSP